MLYVRTLTQEEKDKLYNLVDYNDAEIMERAKIILFFSQGYDVTKISQALNRHPQSVRPWISRFNKRGIEGLFSPKRKGAERKFTDEMRKKIVAVVLSRPADLGLSFTNWSLAKVVAYLIKVGVVDKISHETIRIILAEKGIAWREAKRCLVSNDPNYEMKKQRVMELYENPPKDGVVVCIDEKGSIVVKKYGGNC